MEIILVYMVYMEECVNEDVKEKEKKRTLCVSLSKVVLNSRDRQGNLWLL